jgi:catechol 2,3-dioxygenase-like lactoylglutathione lyase family enzyme
MNIKEIQLLSNNLNETARFYSEVMGFTIAERHQSQISFTVGISKLTFIKTTEANCVYHFAFDIPHNKLDEALKWLTSRVELIAFQESNIIDFPNWNAKSIYFYDNNGNVLEFIARFENRNESIGPFESLSVISISEIALVTDHVEQLANDLLRTYDLNYYFRQIQREDFSVIGNDDGLIILVESTRNWFPTPVGVKKFPLNVMIENGNKEFKIKYE